MGASSIVWTNVFFLSLSHILALWGLYYFITFQICWQTLVWVLLLAVLSEQGITSGAHQLWSHRSYKATLPLRVLLCCGQTVAFQNDIFKWARDHRVHHKFTNSSADPYNSTRGNLFSHISWLVEDKHPDFFSRSKLIDLSDLENDAVVTFQRKYYLILAPLLSFVVPTVVPSLLWNEDIYVAVTFAAVFRYLYTLHGTWLELAVMHEVEQFDGNIERKDYDLHVTEAEDSARQEEYKTQSHIKQISDEEEEPEFMEKQNTRVAITRS